MIRTTIGVLAGLVSVMIFATGSVSGAVARIKPKDCGKLAAGIGGGGELPGDVPAGSVPEVHAFRVSGGLACKTVRSVMQKFEQDASGGLRINKPPAPGWACKFNSKARGYVCKKGKNVIEEQTVFKFHGKTVGRPPRTP